MFFYDTYALIEIAKGNKNYAQYKANSIIVITRLNIIEFVYYLIRLGKKADQLREKITQLKKYTIQYG